MSLRSCEMLTVIRSVLGASLHDVLTRLKAEPQRFPKLEVLYSPDRPVTEPVCIDLPQNGIRLRFDGPEQRLRLVEVLDFTKNHVTFKDRDLLKPANGTSAPGSPVPGETSSAGPTFRHIYHRLLGPTYAGEFIPPTGGQEDGIYVLSYPGVAFNFPMPKAAYSPSKDVVSLLSASSSQVATSMAVFSGDSWAEARPTLFTEVLPSIKTTSALPRGKDVYPDEVSLVRLYGGGGIDLFRKWTSSAFRIQLGETTPQELVMELGPPNAIYRKNDQNMVIHKMRTASNTHSRPSAADIGRPDDLTDTDQSSMNTGSDDSDEEAIDEQTASNPSGACFYNYFYLGFDVLLSTPTPPSSLPPGAEPIGSENPIKTHHPDRLVVTKIVLHGNIPGSYEFNRHRRCRWEIAYLGDSEDGPINSETEFRQVEDRMSETWQDALPAGKGSARQRGMVLNRGWGDSPGSSCEFLGGWEESGARRADSGGESTTTLYGFPGLVFEVLKNDYGEHALCLHAAAHPFPDDDVVYRARRLAVVAVGPEVGALYAVQHLFHHGGRVVVGERHRGGARERVGEVCVEAAELHRERADAERGGERTVEGGLGGGVHGHALPPVDAGAGPDVDEHAPPAAAHVRRHGAHEPVRAEEDRFELAPHLVLADTLGGAVDRPPGVVDEHIDGHAVALLELLYQLRRARRRVHVQRQEAAARVGLDLGDEGRHGGRVAGRGDDGVGAGEGDAREG
ncbi:D-lactate dehydrogenase, mitochondrial precursor [Purpureocillium lavendulum]|uniref:D-lactate dehydrogenase, mitochondrial n=1 Tax=Purpureocillium lavendulum TaxID=1247861 RepID=A0AB34FUT5_9HYPO|nr:D-lactate dehydrogenase, mitochondrial precursor [Purpureocillium lavendulum]